MTEYNCCGLPEPKRSKLSLAKMKLTTKPLSPASQFNITVTEEDIEKLSKGCIPVGTASSTSWAVHTSQQWLKWRNECIPQEVFPADILEKRYATIMWFATLCF